MLFTSGYLALEAKMVLVSQPIVEIKCLGHLRPSIVLIDIDFTLE